ncbi:MAG: hypothetical protein ACQESW_08145 [Bacteroidota bacterium]
MEQQDYLKKQIDKLGFVLKELLSQITACGKNGETSQVIEITNETLRNELDIDIESLISLSSDTFLSILLSKKQLNNDNLELLADNLFQFSENLLQNDFETKKLVRQKVLVIYEYIDDSSNIFSFDRQLRMDKIKNSL